MNGISETQANTAHVDQGLRKPAVGHLDFTKKGSSKANTPMDLHHLNRYVLRPQSVAQMHRMKKIRKVGGNRNQMQNRNKTIDRTPEDSNARNQPILLNYREHFSPETSGPNTPIYGTEKEPAAIHGLSNVKDYQSTLHHGKLPFSHGSAPKMSSRPKSQYNPQHQAAAGYKFAAWRSGTIKEQGDPNAGTQGADSTNGASRMLTNPSVPMVQTNNFSSAAGDLNGPPQRIKTAGANGRSQHPGNFQYSRQQGRQFQKSVNHIRIVEQNRKALAMKPSIGNMDAVSNEFASNFKLGDFSKSHFSQRPKACQLVQQFRGTITDFSGLNIGERISNQETVKSLDEKLKLNFRSDVDPQDYHQTRILQSGGVSSYSMTAVLPNDPKPWKTQVTSLNSSLCPRYQEQIVTRIFSKTKAYSLESNDNCSDGIKLPASFLNVLPTALKNKLSAINNRGQGLNTSLLVNVSATSTHFQIDKNSYHQNLPRNELAHQMKFSKAPKGTHRNTVLCHVAALVGASQKDPEPPISVFGLKGAQAGDDDSVMLPQWVLAKLKMQVGDPICVELDLRQAESQLQEIFIQGSYSVQRLTLEPLQANYIEMSMGQLSPSQEETSSKKPKSEPTNRTQENAKSDDDTSGNGQEILLSRLKKGLERYKVVKYGQILRFLANGKIFEFEVDGIETWDDGDPRQKEERKPFYANFGKPEDVMINLAVGDFCASPRAGAAQQETPHQPTSSRRGAKKQQSEALDLDFILKERGLDIFYMERLLNQVHENRELAKKKQLERKSTKTGGQKSAVKQASRASKRATLETSPSPAKGSPNRQNFFDKSSSRAAGSPKKNGRTGDSYALLDDGQPVKVAATPVVERGSQGKSPARASPGHSMLKKKSPTGPLRENTSRMGQGQQVQNEAVVHQVQMSLQVPGLERKQLNEEGAEKTEDELTLKQVRQGGELRASESGQYRVSYSSKREGRLKALKIAVEGSTEEVEKGSVTSKVSKGDRELSPLKSNPADLDTGREDYAPPQVIFTPQEKQRRRKPSPLKPGGAMGLAVPDFGYEYIKGLQNLKENGLLGSNNKMIIDQNNKKAPNLKSEAEMDPIFNNNPKDVHDMNTMMQINDENYPGRNSNPTEMFIKGQQLDRFRDLEEELVYKFLGIHDYQNSQNQEATWIEIQNQNGQLRGPHSCDSQSLTAKTFPVEQTKGPRDMQDHEMDDEPETLMGAKVMKGESSPTLFANQVAQIQQPNKIVVSNFAGAARQGSRASRRSPLLSKVKSNPGRVDTQPMMESFHQQPLDGQHTHQITSSQVAAGGFKIGLNYKVSEGSQSPTQQAQTVKGKPSMDPVAGNQSKQKRRISKPAQSNKVLAMAKHGSIHVPTPQGGHSTLEYPTRDHGRDHPVNASQSTIKGRDSQKQTEMQSARREQEEHSHDQAQQEQDNTDTQEREQSAYGEVTLISGDGRSPPATGTASSKVKMAKKPRRPKQDLVQIHRGGKTLRTPAPPAFQLVDNMLERMVRRGGAQLTVKHDNVMVSIHKQRTKPGKSTLHQYQGGSRGASSGADDKHNLAFQKFDTQVLKNTVFPYKGKQPVFVYQQAPQDRSGKQTVGDKKEHVKPVLSEPSKEAFELSPSVKQAVAMDAQSPNEQIYDELLIHKFQEVSAYLKGLNTIEGNIKQKNYQIDKIEKFYSELSHILNSAVSDGVDPQKYIIWLESFLQADLVATEQDYVVRCSPIRLLPSEFDHDATSHPKSNRRHQTQSGAQSPLSQLSGCSQPKNNVNGNKINNNDALLNWSRGFQNQTQGGERPATTCKVNNDYFKASDPSPEFQDPMQPSPAFMRLGAELPMSEMALSNSQKQLLYTVQKDPELLKKVIRQTTPDSRVAAPSKGDDLSGGASRKSPSQVVFSKKHVQKGRPTPSPERRHPDQWSINLLENLAKKENPARSPKTPHSPKPPSLTKVHSNHSSVKTPKLRSSSSPKHDLNSIGNLVQRRKANQDGHRNDGLNIEHAQGLHRFSFQSSMKGPSKQNADLGSALKMDERKSLDKAKTMVGLMELPLHITVPEADSSAPEDPLMTRAVPVHSPTFVANPDMKMHTQPKLELGSIVNKKLKELGNQDSNDVVLSPIAEDGLRLAPRINSPTTGMNTENQLVFSTANHPSTVGSPHAAGPTQQVDGNMMQIEPNIDPEAQAEASFKLSKIAEQGPQSHRSFNRFHQEIIRNIARGNSLKNKEVLKNMIESLIISTYALMKAYQSEQPTRKPLDSRLRGIVGGTRPVPVVHSQAQPAKWRNIDQKIILQYQSLHREALLKAHHLQQKFEKKKNLTHRVKPQNRRTIQTILTAQADRGPGVGARDHLEELRNNTNYLAAGGIKMLQGCENTNHGRDYSPYSIQQENIPALRGTRSQSPDDTGPQLDPRKDFRAVARQRALKTLCDGIYSQHNHHNPSIPTRGISHTYYHKENETFSPNMNLAALQPRAQKQAPGPGDYYSLLPSDHAFPQEFIKNFDNAMNGTNSGSIGSLGPASPGSYLHEAKVDQLDPNQTRSSHVHFQLYAAGQNPRSSNATALNSKGRTAKVTAVKSKNSKTSKTSGISQPSQSHSRDEGTHHQNSYLKIAARLKRESTKQFYIE